MSDTGGMAGAAIGGLVTAPSVVVGRGGLAPEVEVGPLCLDFPPDGQTAEHEQGKDEQLLHCVGPSSLDVNLAASLPPGEPTATYLQPPRQCEKRDGNDEVRRPVRTYCYGPDCQRVGYASEIPVTLCYKTLRQGFGRTK